MHTIMSMHNYMLLHHDELKKDAIANVDFLHRDKVRAEARNSHKTCHIANKRFRHYNEALLAFEIKIMYCPSVGQR